MARELENERTRFQESAVWRKTVIAEHAWEYVIGGEGDEWLLLIHGGGGDAESMFRYFIALAPHFRIIVPSIPTALDNMSAITDGLIALFDREGIERGHVYGPSLGGMVAQVFAAHHSDRVSKCIFSHTSLPQPEQAARMHKARLPLRLMPVALFRWQILHNLGKNLKDDIPDITSDEAAFWMARFRNIFGNKLSKADILASVDLQIDFHQQIDLTTSPLRNDAERVMLIFHENDAGFGEEVQDAMQTFYVGAHSHRLPLYGHLGSAVRADEVIELIKLFLCRMKDNSKEKINA